MFHIGPSCFDGVETGTVRGQKEDAGASIFDKLANLIVLVGIEIVHAHDMTRT